MFKGKRIPRKYKLALFALLLIGIGLLLILFLRGHTIAVLSPEGPIASKERRLMIYASLLGVLIIIPVFVLTAFIAWKYRATNIHSKYTPDWDHNIAAEAAWWLIPLVIITVLSVITWISSHELDPSIPIAGNAQPLTIQVVALRWKWLFIYPKQSIATVNYVQFPEKTPINFEITADAPMNSFWIPRLGGQMYAMSGMSTRLHLLSNEVEDFNGSSANISGPGFAGMKFIARSSTPADFYKWMHTVQRSFNYLDQSEYNKLSSESKNNPPFYYYLGEPDLYNKIVMKFMDPSYKVPDSLQHMHSEEQ